MVPGIDIAGNAQTAQHGLAELMNCGDGRIVEGAERVAQPPLPDLQLIDRPGLTHRVPQHRMIEAIHLVRGVGAGDGMAQGQFGADQAFTHPLAQFLGGGAAEGDHQQLLQRQPLGDLPGDQGGNRPCLAGAGGSLEDRGAAGQWACDVEDLKIGPRVLPWTAVHAPAPLVSAGCQTRMAVCPKREGTGGPLPAAGGHNSSGAGGSSQMSRRGVAPYSAARAGSLLS